MTNNIYLALGDSITAGYGVGRNNSFATMYYNVLRMRCPGLRYLNLGINGLTTGDLARMLTGNARLRCLVANACLITITVGSNDLLALGKASLTGGTPPIALALNQLAVNLQVIGSQLRRINPRAKIQLATIYNPLTYNALAQSMVTQANSLLGQTAATYGFILVPVERAIQNRPNLTLGPDRFHPSLLGQQLIVTQFLST